MDETSLLLRWWPILTVLIPLALIGYLYNKFASTKDTERIEKEVKNEVKELETMLCKKIDRLSDLIEKAEERQEKRYVSLQEFNGLAQRLDSRMDDLKERTIEAEQEARIAYNMAQSSNTAVQHLTQRIEDVINNAITELKREMGKMSDVIRKIPS